MKRSDLLALLSEQYPDRYSRKKHQRCYAWFSGGGISIEAAADVADVLDFDREQRRDFALAAGLDSAVSLLEGGA